MTINRARQVTAVFAGPLDVAHDAACAWARASATQHVDAAFDVVVSTNGGYPLDRNLYQAVKGMAAAERIVRDGGIIVMAAACVDGIPGDGAFAEVLAGARSADDLIDARHGRGARPLAGPGDGSRPAAGRGVALQRGIDGRDGAPDALLHPVPI